MMICDLIISIINYNRTVPVNYHKRYAVKVLKEVAVPHMFSTTCPLLLLSRESRESRDSMTSRIREKNMRELQRSLYYIVYLLNVIIHDSFENIF